MTCKQHVLVLAAIAGLLIANSVIAWPGDPTVNVPVTTALKWQVIDDIVSDGLGGAIITISDRLYQAEAMDFYAQRMDGSGNVLWTATTKGTAICTASGVQDNSAIASDGSGGAIIAWADNRSGTDYDIYAQRVDASGNVQWITDGIAICTASGDQMFTYIVTDGSDGAIVAWQDHRGDDWDVYAQRVDASGNVQWTTNGVAISAASGDQRKDPSQERKPR